VPWKRTGHRSLLGVGVDDRVIPSLTTPMQSRSQDCYTFPLCGSQTV